MSIPGVGAGKGDCPRRVDGETYRKNFDAIDWGHDPVLNKMKEWAKNISIGRPNLEWQVAQPVEHGTVNAPVEGSNPSLPVASAEQAKVFGALGYHSEGEY